MFVNQRHCCGNKHCEVKFTEPNQNSENYYYICIPAVRSAVKIEYTLDQHVQDGIHRLI